MTVIGKRIGKNKNWLKMNLNKFLNLERDLLTSFREVGVKRPDEKFVPEVLSKIKQLFPTIDIKIDDIYLKTTRCPITVDNLDTKYECNLQISNRVLNQLIEIHPEALI